MATTKKSKPSEDITVAKQMNGEEMVDIIIPRGRGDNAPVYVACNDRTWYIKRGVKVTVPICVKEILDFSDAAYDYAENYKGNLDEE